MGQYSKPMVTIELEEYNNLKKRDVTEFSKGLSSIFNILAKTRDNNLNREVIAALTDQGLTISYDEKNLPIIHIKE